ncbi:MAG: hypothetical protein WA816_06425 [Bacteroidales bacterium]
MIRLLKSMTFFILTIGLLSSGTTEIRFRNIFRNYSSETIKEDTTGLIHLLEIDPFKLNITPPSSGVQFFKDGIVFLSLTKNERKMSSNHISFGAVEAYNATIEDSVLGRHKIFSQISSFSFPCEAMTFTRDYDTVYFTKLLKKDNKEKIFMAKFTSNRNRQTGWVSENTPVDFCTGNYNYTHPALSADEKMMIFASDKTGSFGGMDLFVSRLAKGKWSEPENLGNFINTSRNEFFPFLDSENNLFFSSDGLPGYGGYDIFTSKFNGSGWDKPINLSGRINSANDEIAFTINKIDGKTAFFTRRQKSGKDNMQLFMVTLKKDVQDRNLLTLSYVFNGKPLTETRLFTDTLTEFKPAEVKTAMNNARTEIIKKEDVKAPEQNVSSKNIPDKLSNIRPETIVKPSEAKEVAIKPSIPVTVEQKDIVIYRIQFLPSTKQKSEKEIILNGKSYKIFEYYYLGASRCTIGEFTTLKFAVELQRICRQSGYPQSFVVAFKNNIRSLDTNLFR